MRTAADLCTALRLTLAPIFAWRIAAGSPGWLPLALYVTAVLSDFADGRLARAGGRVSPRGRLFDHGADVLFLLPALVVLGRAGRIPIALAAAVAVTFGLYCVDGWRRGRQSRSIQLAPSRSGTAAGLANYAVVGLAAIASGWGPSRLDSAVYTAALATIAVNAAAALERLQGFLRSAELAAIPPPERHCTAAGD